MSLLAKSALYHESFNPTHVIIYDCLIDSRHPKSIDMNGSELQETEIAECTYVTHFPVTITYAGSRFLALRQPRINRIIGTGTCVSDWPFLPNRAVPPQSALHNRALWLHPVLRPRCILNNRCDIEGRILRGT